MHMEYAHGVRGTSMVAQTNFFDLFAVHMHSNVCILSDPSCADATSSYIVAQTLMLIPSMVNVVLVCQARTANNYANLRCLRS